MSAQVAKANLTDALKMLHQRWERAKSQWDDKAAQDFQRQVIDPIEPRVRAAVKSFEHVSELIATVRRECSEDVEG
ncbi:MAG: hypothetical protein AMXMBFR58_01350 [Phycisphaerae bacterium]|nr:hypothetical protein [Phycisphaerales bacterium]MCK6477680.1 hypothetical protein [Phycisphaerales bacterium]